MVGSCACQKGRALIMREMLQLGRDIGCIEIVGGQKSA